MAQVLYTNGKIEEVQPANGTDFTLKELYFWLSCTTVEAFELASGKMMICDAESKLSDDWEVNIKATEMWRIGRMESFEVTELIKKNDSFIDAREDTLDCIGGDALICDVHEFL